MNHFRNLCPTIPSHSGISLIHLVSPVDHLTISASSTKSDQSCLFIVGEPIADAFAVCARKNSGLLIVADGVNWGEKSMLAARCAVYGCVQFIQQQLFSGHSPLTTTHVSHLSLSLSLSPFPWLPAAPSTDVYSSYSNSCSQGDHRSLQHT